MEPIVEDEILKIISKFDKNKSPDHDGIGNLIVERAANELNTKPLAAISIYLCQLVKFRPTSTPLWTPNKKSHKHKLEGVQRSFTRYCFPGPWHSRPSYDTRLRILDIPTTISRFDYLRTMFVVGCLWGMYDISWEDYTKVNTSNSRQAVNVDFRHFRSRTDAFHNSQEFGSPYPMMSPVKLSSICFRFCAVCVDLCTFIINCFYFLLCQLGFRRPFK